jgi:hypothetical protein
VDYKVTITGVGLHYHKKNKLATGTVFYKENVPINPDKAGRANIYPEGRRSHL